MTRQTQAKARRAARIVVFVAATVVGAATVPAAFAYLPSGRSVGWGVVAVSGDIDTSTPPTPSRTPSTPAPAHSAAGVPDSGEPTTDTPPLDTTPLDTPPSDTSAASEPPPTPSPSSPEPEPAASDQPVVASSAPSAM
jgi:hypothetical protein